MFKRLGLALAFVSVLGAGAAHAQQAALVFTAIPDEDETRLVERFSQYAKYFEGKLGVPVRYLPVKSYPAAVTAFTNNQVQFAWFGGLTGVQARLAVPGSQAIAQGAEDLEFKSYIIAHASTGLKLAKDFPKGIEGKTFTFGARSSTSGRLFPEHFIRQALGKEPDKVFSRVGYSGDHSRTIQLVQSGAYQVGVLNHLVWDQEVKSGKVDTKTVSVIWETPTYPDYHWVARGDIDKTFGAGFTSRLQASILGVDDPKLLAIFDRKKFIPAKNDDYKVIEEVGKLTGLIN
ncbi:MAG: putative selenate ABC transporter substrate-binding protein [Hyphomicrobiaceae bacterium]